MKPASRAVVNKDALPNNFPTHAHQAEFWEHLGRCVATYGFLEEVLAKAIFAFTAATEHSPSEIEAAYERWLPTLKSALTGQLNKLADMYAKAVRENKHATIENLPDLVGDIKRAATVRNMLCHASWRPQDAEGRCEPHYVNNKLEKFDGSVDVAYLCQVQQHVAELSVEVISTVTHMGYEFPGGAGPGKQIWR